MGIIAAGQITVVDLSDAPVLNTFITASRPTTQTYSKDSRTYKPSYASTPQVLTLKVTKGGSTANIIDSISSLHWFVVDGPIKTEITSKDNSANEYISGTHNEILTTKLDIDLNKGSKRYEVMGIWPDPSTGLDVQFGGYIDLLLTQNGATGPQGPQGNTGNGIANTVIAYGLSMSDTTEPATWSSERPALVKGMYLWVRTVIIYTNGGSTTSYQISYIAKDADESAIDKAKQELLEKLETVRDESLEAVDEAKHQLVTVRDESLAAAEEAKQGLINVNNKVDNAKEELTQAKQDLANVASELNTAKQDLTDSVTAVNNKVDNAKEELTQAKQDLANVASELNTAKQDFQNAVSAVDTKATNLKSDLAQAKQDLASQAQQLQEQATAQSELTNRVSSVEETANGTKTTVSELSKTVAQNGKDITSVTARTKVVEDDLSGTKTTLSQVKTTADSASQKTATLETGLNGLSAKFDNLRVGGANLLLYSADPSKAPSGYYDLVSTQKTSETYNGSVVYRVRSIWSGLKVNLGNLVDRGLLKVGDVLTYSVAMRAEQAAPIQARLFIRYTNQSGADSPTGKIEIVNLTADWQYVSATFTVTAKMLAENTKVTYLGWELTSNAESGKYVYYACNKIERGNVATDYTPNESDLEQKVAEYKQNADQNYASLQTTVQNLDGTVQHNKTVADQTAQGFTTRIESLETYKDGESTRANQYFELAKTETARQLTAERTAIAKDYVAKSTYTSDVTGIRNDLTATTTTANTTKTNLANYQASNDRAVANLQSNLQTANGDISSLKTKVEAVPGQITSAVSAVEGKIPTSVGSVNLFKGSRDFSGSWVNGGAGVYAEDYQGVKIFKRQNVWSGLSQYFEVKTGEEYVFSAYVKSSAKTDGVTFYLNHSSKQPVAGGNVSFENADGRDSISFDLSDTYKRIAVKIKIVSTGWIMPRIERYNTDAYLFFGGYKLERGNIATDWSPAPEDTVEQISSLSSQIQQTADGMTLLATKTELNSAKNELQSGITAATNKANAAQNTANNNAQTISTHTTQISALNTGLQAKVSQTEFNTLSGRVTTAENNITAKANELSSKITSVEGKIPTTVGGRNLLVKTNQGKTNWYWSTSNSGTTSEDHNVDGVNAVKLTRTIDGTASWSYVQYNGLMRNLIEPNTKYTLSFDIYPSQDVTFSALLVLGDGSGPLTDRVNMNKAKANKWTKVSCVLSTKETLSNLLGQVVYLQGMPIAKGNYLIIKNIKLEKGAVSSDWSPAPEDTASQISSLSSELKQTKDGITLLATKTELNTAKNELQSGINTATNKANAAQNTANNNAQTISSHTTQISALNTGLQAKVSQSEFNTLSGRVTSAENNITAKANELTSKITSVEGKIPTEIGAVNLFKGSRDFSGSWLNAGAGVYAEDYKGVKIFKRQNVWSGLSQYFEVKTGEEYVFSAYVKSSAKTDGVNFYLYHDSKQPTASGLVSSGSVSGQNTIYFELTDKYKRIAIKIKITKDGWIAPRIERGDTNAYLFFGGYKLERGNIATDWTPAPEDTISQIDAVSSELKQTKDGITLLATKTELNNAKNELQSGINTATNKANAAQNTANNNAQTINNHTTQISALNTGLQAKVSQTEFNTLSGRVTSAENNITAKANELTSKITSVEGKIPTAVGGRNLLSKTNQGKTNWAWSISSGGTTAEDYNVDGVKAVKLTRTTSASASWDYIQYRGLIRNLIEPNTKYTLSFDVKPNVDVTFWASLKRGDAGASLTNAASMNKATANKWTKVSCVLTSNATLSSDTSQVVYLNGMSTTNGNWLIIKNIKLEKGVVSSDWSPAPEDTISQIDAVSSELKQTKDGITLLATKTELNNAKNDLQSGINTATNKANAAQNTANNNAQTINTHTTQISALNTGLSAKVSQSDFNTLSGRVTNAENNIIAKANELSSKITSVEGKIPTSVGSTNLLLYSADPWKAPSGYYDFVGAVKTNDELNGSVVYKTNTAWASLRSNWGKQLIDRKNVKVGDEFTYSIYAKTDQTSIITRLFIRYSGQSNAEALSSDITLTNEWKKLSVTFKVTQKMVASQTKVSWVGFEQTSNSENGKFVYYACNKLERGKIATDYSPAPEDAISQISSLSSELKQTKDGITLLATKTELNSAKNELQSGINTATNKANSNAQTISTHTNQISALNTGLSAKVSQSDFNTLSGRVTNAENNIIAKANELSSKITSIEGKIPTEIGAVNLFKGSRDFSGSWMNAGAGVYAEDYKGVKIFKRQNVWNGLSQYFEVKTGEEYVFSAYVKSSAKTDGVNFFLVHESKQPMAEGVVSFGSTNSTNNVNIGLTDKYKRIAVKIKITKDGWIAPRLERYNSDHYLLFGGYKLERGTVATDWEPAPEDHDSKLAAAQSEFKQTTDAIKASVTSLDRSTIKSSSLTINSDGIVMKAGKSTTDVANAIGSYFSVNQNAINLFSDKINVKGSMIVNGTITGDKIKANSVDVSKISGLDANFIKSKIEYAMIDWLKGKTITAYNGNMTIDLQNGRISFKDGSNAVYRQTSDGIHTGFLHFEAGSQGGVYAAFGTTSTRQGINSKSSEFAGIRCYRVSANGDSHAAKIDKIEVIGDTVQFGHTYHPNGTIGGGFIMNTAAYYDDPPYSLNRMVSSIESLWRILYVHGKNVGYNLSHPNFINALRDEYNAWHDMHNR